MLDSLDVWGRDISAEKRKRDSSEYLRYLKSVSDFNFWGKGKREE